MDSELFQFLSCSLVVYFMVDAFMHLDGLEMPEVSHVLEVHNAVGVATLPCTCIALI